MYVRLIWLELKLNVRKKWKEIDNEEEIGFLGIKMYKFINIEFYLIEL